MYRIHNGIRRRMLKEDGQAIFEFIFFISFFLFIFSNYLTIAESINGSINQEKVTRGYFFARIKGNSYAPEAAVLIGQKGVVKLGMAFIGWREKEIDQMPVAPCYTLSSLGSSTEKEKCDDEYSASNKTTQHIRPKTAFGVCGETYGYNEYGVQGIGPSALSGDFSSCTSN